MTKEQIHNLIEMLRASVPGFNVHAERATDIWHSVLEPYSRDEVWIAVKHITAHTDGTPTPKTIKSMCDSNRRRERHEKMLLDGEKQLSDAARTFEGIPGRTRAENVAYIQGEQSARHWIAGLRDNDYHNDKILAAKKLGFVFEGVDYSQVNVSHDYVGICNDSV